MQKLLFLICVLLCLNASAQTLFTYGNDSVSVQEFIHAFNKNNSSGTGKKAVNEYLDIYIASRLKVKEAKARGYHTQPQFVTDLQNLRQQIVPAYLADKQSIDNLVKQAFERSQKDIHLAHMYIPFTLNGETDSALALTKAKEAYNKLLQYAPFAEVAKQYSADPSVSANGGDMGYITLFSLPYELENLAYATPVNQISTLYKSKSGYHIFKNLGERKALGKVSIAQILLAYPPEANEQQKEAVKKLADSIYNRLQKEDTFEQMVQLYSNDYISAPANGRVPEFGIGQYEPEFENAAFALSQPNAISRPFATKHGYHIIKLLEKVDVNTNAGNSQAMQALKDKIEQDSRIELAKEALIKNLLQQGHVKQLPFNINGLKAFTDSVMDNATSTLGFTIKNNTPLIQTGNQTLTAQNWLNYIKEDGYNADGELKNFSVLWSGFLNKAAIDYYTDHLEELNPQFNIQMTEFEEGNLFFEIMQQEVWTPSQTDTVAIRTFYNKHQHNYTWKKSADAVMFYVSDTSISTPLLQQLKKAPSNWRNIIAAFGDKVTTDSGRFEQSTLLNGNKGVLKNLQVTEPVSNPDDLTVSFAYVVKLYNKPLQQTFDEARGFVINDYGTELDGAWIKKLKEKYPVWINEKALKDLKL